MPPTWRVSLPVRSGTDRLRSSDAALRDPGCGNDQDRGRCLNHRADNAHRRLEDASGRCSGSGACDHCRGSLQPLPRTATPFRRSATSRTTTPTSKPAPPLSQSGAAFPLSHRIVAQGWELVRNRLTAPEQAVLNALGGQLTLRSGQGAHGRARRRRRSAGRRRWQWPQLPNRRSPRARHRRWRGRHTPLAPDRGCRPRR